MKTATIRKLTVGVLAVTAMCAVSQSAASPASAASDTASRAQCSNNLKQISLGSRALANGASDLALWQSCYGTGIY